MQAESVTLSVIVPAWNVEKYVQAALESVLDQSCLPDEVIVVDDGSTDGTSALLAEISQRHPLIRVVRTVNQGLGPARNRGLSLAQGDYVYFFDSDDVLAPDFVASIKEAILKQGHPDVLFFAGESFRDEGVVTDFSPAYPRNVTGIFSHGDGLMLRMMQAGCFYSSACLYVSRRALWVANGFEFKPIVHEDEELLVPLCHAASRILVMDRVFFHRRIRQGSIMTAGVTQRHVDGCLAIVESLAAFHAAHHDESAYESKAIRRRFRWFVSKYVSQGRDSGLRLQHPRVWRALMAVGDPVALVYYVLCLLPAGLRRRLRKS